MPTKTAVKTEVFVECEVKRRRVRENGKGYEPFWKLKTVQEALTDGDTEFRCKDCHGAVKLHKRPTIANPVLHAEHKLRIDSEYCPSGYYFKEAVDGRVTRLSAAPVA